MTELELLSRQLRSLPTTDKPTSHCKLGSGDVIANYEIDRYLGKGRFSTVWSAKNKLNGSVVAIKVYRVGSDNETYYANEVQILNKIFEYSLATQQIPTNLIGYLGTVAHVNLDSNRSPKIHPCVLFNLAGDSVSKLLKHCNRNYGKGLPIGVVKKIMRDILKGLSYLHNCGIIHTDIKPSNLLLNGTVESLDESGLVVSIGDLGSSTFANELFSYHVGTTQYIAPELILELPYSYPIDIWAAFATCFELITGDLLFDVFGECGITYGEDIDDCLSCDEYNDKSNKSNKSKEYSNGAVSDSSGSSEDEDEEKTNYRHLCLIEKVIGPAPREFTRNARLYYNRRDKLKNNPDIAYMGIAELLYSNYEMSEEDCKQIEDFLLCGLKYLPEDRISADTALQHPFLN
ncbi:mitogen-activated protein kinase [Pacmanvirus S19]|nr:mitogen-activated protein kinase [Pacmanvirus S19]